MTDRTNQAFCGDSKSTLVVRKKGREKQKAKKHSSQKKGRERARKGEAAVFAQEPKSPTAVKVLE